MCCSDDCCCCSNGNGHSYGLAWRLSDDLHVFVEVSWEDHRACRQRADLLLQLSGRPTIRIVRIQHCIGSGA